MPCLLDGMETCSVVVLHHIVLYQAVLLCIVVCHIILPCVVLLTRREHNPNKHMHTLPCLPLGYS